MQLSACHIYTYILHISIAKVEKSQYRLKTICHQLGWAGRHLFNKFSHAADHLIHKKQWKPISLSWYERNFLVLCLATDTPWPVAFKWYTPKRPNQCEHIIQSISNSCSKMFLYKWISLLMAHAVMLALMVYRSTHGNSLEEFSLRIVFSKLF